MFRLYLFFLMVGCSFVSLRSQCNIEAQKNVCINDIVFFTLKSTSSATINKYSWNFGSYGISNNIKPSIKVTATGKLTVTCEVEYSNGTKCKSSFDLIINGLPEGKMVYATGTNRCFSGNKICLKDSSKLAGAGIKKISVLWTDGKLDQVYAPVKTLCRSFSFAGTHEYDLEAEDSFGCKSNIRDKVEVLPKPSVGQTRFNYTDYCDSVSLCLRAATDNSYKYLWKDNNTGKTLSANKDICITLKPGQKIVYKCVVTNSVGCRDSVLFYEGAIDRKLKASISVRRICLSEVGGKSLTGYANQFLNWYINGVYIGTRDTMYFTNVRPGWNYVRGEQQLPCKEQLIDSFYVVPINASGMVYNAIRDKFIDTVYYLDLSHNPPGSKIYREWRFDDDSAGSCTTSRVHNMNVNANCGISWDSLASHYYKNRKEKCFFRARLYIKDSVTGCEDDTVFRICRSEYCGPFVTPPLVCIGDPVYFDYTECLGAKSGLNNQLRTGDKNVKTPITLIPGAKYKFYYTDTGWYSPVFEHLVSDDTIWRDSSGIIVRSGIRKLGWKKDTFYHAVKVVYKPGAAFKLVNQVNCKTRSVELDFIDSLWAYPDSMFVDWGDGIKEEFVYRNLTEIPLKNMKHNYQKQGTYKITVKLRSLSSCISKVTRRIDVGFIMGIVPEGFCNGKNSCFKAVVMSADSTSCWYANGGMGSVQWDFGNGMQDTNFISCTRYKTPGTYNVKLVATSTEGCKDSIIVKHSTAGPVAAIKEPPVVYCSLIQTYYDSSFMFGATGTDYINNWLWDFGDNTGTSTVQNPSHIYKGGGKYLITLVVKTQKGCVDTIVKELKVKGPQVKARIITDSVGCAPLKVIFGNNSKETGNFIWQFNDPQNTIFATRSDTAKSFIYRQPGIYYPKLIGGDSFYNPNTGSKYFCSVTFPPPGDTALRVEVFPRATVYFKLPDSACLNQWVSIENASPVMVNKYDLKVDTLRSFLNQPFNKFSIPFHKTGVYSITLISKPQELSEKTCPDTLTRLVRIVNHKVDFSEDCKKSTLPNRYFTNTSALKADVFKWEIEKTSSGKKTEVNERDLKFNYAYDTGLYKICLMTKDSNYCYDPVCKEININKAVFMANVFTPGKDGYNDVFKIPFTGLKNFHIRIYNRYGALLFESGDPLKSWNGKVNNTGSEVPSGTYYYNLSFLEDCKDKATIIKGAVELIR